MHEGGFRELVVWQKSMDFADAVYALTQQFPADERFGLTAQVRRAVVSVPSNIAEGNGRESLKDYLRHLSIAHGSLAEVETQLELAYRQQFVTEEQRLTILEQAHEVGRLLNGLRRSLRRKLV